MNQRCFLATVALGATVIPLLITQQVQSQATPQISTQATGKQTSAAHTQQPHQDEGERIFQQNCSRCHTTPEGFSPRISGTVVRHMRVRASLSQHDEQELLRFFNP